MCSEIGTSAWKLEPGLEFSLLSFQNVLYFAKSLVTELTFYIHYNKDIQDLNFPSSNYRI